MPDDVIDSADPFGGEPGVSSEGPYPVGGGDFLDTSEVFDQETASDAYPISDDVMERAGDPVYPVGDTPLDTDTDRVAEDLDQYTREDRAELNGPGPYPVDTDQGVISEDLAEINRQLNENDRKQAALDAGSGPYPVGGGGSGFDLDKVVSGAEKVAKQVADAVTRDREDARRQELQQERIELERRKLELLQAERDRKYADEQRRYADKRADEQRRYEDQRRDEQRRYEDQRADRTAYPLPGQGGGVVGPMAWVSGPLYPPGAWVSYQGRTYRHAGSSATSRPPGVDPQWVADQGGSYPPPQGASYPPQGGYSSPSYPSPSGYPPSSAAPAPGGSAADRVRAAIARQRR